MVESMLIGFPAGGFEKKVSYRQDKPFATPDCLNVRPAEVIEGRERGGSRPGLQGPSGQDLGGEVRLLAPMSLAPGRFMLLRDTFYADSLGSEWEQMVGQYHTGLWPLPVVMENGHVGTGTLLENAIVHAVHTNTSIDITKTYIVEMYIAPHEGQLVHSDYYLYAASLSNSTPDIMQDGAYIAISLNPSLATWYFYGTAFLNGVGGFSYHMPGDHVGYDITKGGWFRVTYQNTTAVSASFDGTTKTINESWTDAGSTYRRTGFRIQTRTALPNPPYTLTPAKISMFEAQYTSSVESEPPLNRTLLVASAGGNLHEEWSVG